MDEPFPGIDTLLVRRRYVRPMPSSGSDFQVVIEYGFPEIDSTTVFDNPPGDDQPPRLEYDTATVIKRTNKGIPTVDFPDGQPVQIRDYLPLEYNDAGQPTGLASEFAPPQGGMVDVPVPISVFRFHRREYPVDSRGRTIRQKCKSFVGRGNKTTIDGDPPRTWLCSRIGAHSDDRWQTVNVSYEFQYNPDSWDATVVYIDPKTGQPGDGIGSIFLPGGGGDLLNGIKTFQVIREAEFNDLDLYI
jgi:hypothetical protein